ncbi:basic leucine zipper transcriptional factor ATF-like 3 isoform X1 [Polyodon spathula]|uniref:basic leucine zipper transcriptional factor ATF-like 3 isoform X1 n=1 Tax=Polyodon spathula TaxID=7913 RepID=UPI001B7E7676|nr:basic leucine zipper transcriptional factor ATF-like 3 isoform X1 [Polyodon spathula]
MYLSGMDSPGGVNLQSTSEDDGSSQGTSDSNFKHSDRKMTRRAKNRAAAQKSRQKHTERADTLHQELENLEKENSAFQKEIAGLRRELEHYNKVLKDHEPKCTLLPSYEVQNFSSGLSARHDQNLETDILASNWPDLSFLYPVL